MLGHYSKAMRAFEAESCPNELMTCRLELALLERTFAEVDGAPASSRLSHLHQCLSLLGDCADCLRMLRADPLEIVSTYRPVGGVTVFELLGIYLKQVRWAALAIYQLLSTAAETGGGSKQQRGNYKIMRFSPVNLVDEIVTAFHKLSARTISQNDPNSIY